MGQRYQNLGCAECESECECESLPPTLNYNTTISHCHYSTHSYILSCVIFLAADVQNEEQGCEWTDAEEHCFPFCCWLVVASHTAVPWFCFCALLASSLLPLPLPTQSLVGCCVARHCSSSLLWCAACFCPPCYHPYSPLCCPPLCFRPCNGLHFWMVLPT